MAEMDMLSRRLRGDYCRLHTRISRVYCLPSRANAYGQSRNVGSSMTPGQWADIGIGLLSVILVPFIVLLFRLTVQATKLVDRVNVIERDFRELTQNTAETQKEILKTIREDRNATDRRLRWLEEHLWKGTNSQ